MDGQEQHPICVLALNKHNYIKLIFIFGFCLSACACACAWCASHVILLLSGYVRMLTKNPYVGLHFYEVDSCAWTLAVNATALDDLRCVL